LLAILQRNSPNQQIFSIVLSQIGSLTFTMSDVLTCACTLETLIVSVERIREYTNLTPEARDVIPDSKTDEAWPQHGQITFNQYSTRYREGLDLVLKDVTVTINGGERVGIVGRTGAGKSSVTLALFRIIEAAKGSILIDGIDISTLGLHELRSRLTIIPQDPFLFGDSIR
ncbi:Multidrug resistance-associated protein 1, partial [Mortierella sp. AD094]